MKKIICLFCAFVLCLFGAMQAFAAGYTVVVQPQYNMAEAFSVDVTKVSKDSKWALANLSGTPVTGYNWDALGEVLSDRIPAQKNGVWGYIDTTGTEKLAFRYKTAGCFSEGIAMVQNSDGTVCYINVNGEVLFSSPFVYSFSPREGAICGSVNGLYGFCDTAGNITVTPQYEMAFDFHEGYAAVKSGGKWGYINKSGAMCITPYFDYASDFTNGCAVVRVNGKYGIIDAAGMPKTTYTFDYIGAPGENGLYPANAGGVCGYINQNGVWTLKTAYDYVYRYTDGVARVYQNGKWGYINESGAELVAPTFTDCGEYKNGRAAYSSDGYLWGYLTLNTQKQTEQKPTENPVVTPSNPNDEVFAPTNSLSNLLPEKPTREKCISMKIGSNIVYKNAEQIEISASPVLMEGTTMIPVRAVSELLGGTVEWNAEKQHIAIDCKNVHLSMTVGSKIYFAAGVPKVFSAAPAILNGSTVVPLRSIADSLGCTVEWKEQTKNIFIYY